MLKSTGVINMNRREFLGNAIKIGMAAGASFFLKDFNPVFGLDEALPARLRAYDMVAVKGGEPDVMFDTAMKAMGGMKNFVKPGQTVLVKPNIGWAVSPDLGATTNPVLVSRIIKHCIDAGAKKVLVFDHSCDSGPSCYKISGIEDAVKNAGGVMVPGDNPGYYHNTAIPGSAVLKSADFHETFLESDVFINVPVLKNHRMAQLTIGMKNYMGVVWARDQWHRTDLEACIADCPLVRKPDLTVVDAYAVMMTNGPRGHSKGDVSILKNLLVSTDMLAADVAAAKIFGTDPMNIGYLKKASESGLLGNSDLSQLSIKKILL
jgi:uncharacterized protein (DUF362 family)